MGLFSKLFGSKKEEMPIPVEVCQVRVDESEAKKKKTDNEGVSVDPGVGDHTQNHKDEHSSWLDSDSGDSGSDGGGD